MYSNDDKPGVLGAVSTILGQANINIGDFNMGRNKKTAVALR
jgi:predicted amino acid-binding ACT domain protein